MGSNKKEETKRRKKKGEKENKSKRAMFVNEYLGNTCHTRGKHRRSNFAK